MTSKIKLSITTSGCYEGQAITVEVSQNLDDFDCVMDSVNWLVGTCRKLNYF